MLDPKVMTDSIDLAFTEHVKLLFANLAMAADRDEAEKRFAKGFTIAVDAHARAMRIIKAGAVP